LAGTAQTLTPTPTRITESALSIQPTSRGPSSPGSPRSFHVILVREGPSKSANFFARRAVEDVAHLAAGARAFADHPTPTELRERPARSVRDVVGFYDAAHTTVDPDTNLLQAEATLRIFESAAWLATIAAEALTAAPDHELIGLSIDSVVLMSPGQPIATCGKTGCQPWAHLHFEVRYQGPPQMPIDFWGGRLKPAVQNQRYADPYTLLRLLEGVDLSLQSPELLAQLAGAQEQLSLLRADRDFNYDLKMRMEAYLRSVEGKRPRIDVGCTDKLIASVAR
jgi:hypothetical protein